MTRTALLGTALIGGLILATGCSTGANSKQASTAVQDRGPLAAASGKSSAASSQSGATASLVALSHAKTERKVVIQTADMVIVVNDPKGVGDHATTIATKFGGYVDNQSVSRNVGVDVQITLKVPAADFATAVEAIARLGKLDVQNIKTEDETAKSVDLASRITSQRASVERVQTFLKNSSNVTDLLAVENELRTREAELESLQAQLDALNGQTAYSTINAHFTEQPVVVKAKTKTKPGFVSGVKSGWKVFTTFVAALAVIFGFLVPLLPLIVIGGALMILVRRRNRRTRPTQVVVPPRPAAP